MTGEGAETIMMTGGERMTSMTEEDPAVTEKTGEEEAVTETTLRDESLQVEDTLHPPHPMAGDTEHDPGAEFVFIKTTCIIVILSTSAFL